jgi:hypothetical protein
MHACAYISLRAAAARQFVEQWEDRDTVKDVLFTMKLIVKNF